MSVLVTKLRRDLRRQRWQFLAALVTVTLGVALYGASFDAYRNLQDSYARTYDRLALADLTIFGGDRAGIAADAEDASGVAAVTQRTQADVPFVVDETSKLLGRVVGMPAQGQPAVNKVDVTTGTYLRADQPRGVLVEQHMADHFALGPGSSLEVVGDEGPERLVVVGVAQSAEYLWPAQSRQQVLTTPDNFGVLFVPEPLAARLGGRLAVPQVLVRFAGGSADPVVVSELADAARAAGATNVQPRAEQPSNAALQEDVDGFGQLSYLFPVLFLTAAGLATWVLLTRLVYGQRATIGTLRANGLARRQVLRHYLAYGLVVGVGGAVVGSALGALLGWLVTGTYTSALSIPDTVVRFRPLTIAVGLAFGLAAGLAASWAPASAGAKVPPAEAMRGNEPPARAGLSLVEKLVPPLRRLPARWRMVLRGIGRNRRRSLSTIGGVVLALVLILASWGMVDTTTVLLDRQFNEIQLQDAQVFFDAPIGEEMLGGLAGVEGVRRVERAAQTAATLSRGDQAYATELTAFEPGTEMHGFRRHGGGTEPLPDQGVLVGAAIRGLIEVEAGDEVRMALPTLGTTVVTTVAGFVEEPLGTPAYVSLAELRRLLRSGSPAVDPSTLEEPGIGSALADYDPGVARDQVRRGILALPETAAFVDSRALFDTVQRFLGFFYVFVGVMLVFGGLMAFTLLFNTMSVNIAERSGELATLRSNGLSRGKVAKLLTGENLLLTVAGIIPGLVAGVALSALFMQSFSSDLFQFDLQLRPSTPVLAAAAVLAVAFLSQWPGLRAVSRLDIARVVRERAQ